jgi:hypothetical protein
VKVKRFPGEEHAYHVLDPIESFHQLFREYMP